jgi:hypothetical protein
MDVEEGQVTEFGEAKEHEPRFSAGPIAKPAGLIQVLSMSPILRTGVGSLAGVNRCDASWRAFTVVDLELLDQAAEFCRGLDQLLGGFLSVGGAP